MLLKFRKKKDTFSSVEKYEGQYKDGKRNGHGIYTWSDGTIYEGQFVDNKMSGHGTYMWPDGEQFEGQWEVG